jgi:hypothetical protein
MLIGSDRFANFNKARGIPFSIELTGTCSKNSFD